MDLDLTHAEGCTVLLCSYRLSKDTAKTLERHVLDSNCTFENAQSLPDEEREFGPVSIPAHEHTEESQIRRAEHLVNTSLKLSRCVVLTEPKLISELRWRGDVTGIYVTYDGKVDMSHPPSAKAKREADMRAAKTKGKSKAVQNKNGDQKPARCTIFLVHLSQDGHPADRRATKRSFDVISREFDLEVVDLQSGGWRDDDLPACTPTTDRKQQSWDEAGAAVTERLKVQWGQTCAVIVPQWQKVLEYLEQQNASVYWVKEDRVLGVSVTFEKAKVTAKGWVDATKPQVGFISGMAAGLQGWFKGQAES